MRIQRAVGLFMRIPLVLFHLSTGERHVISPSGENPREPLAWCRGRAAPRRRRRSRPSWLRARVLSKSKSGFWKARVLVAAYGLPHGTTF